MNENSCRVSDEACRVSKYSEISRDVWVLFKKYLPTNADLNEFTDDVHKLDEKYRVDVRQYCFMQQLLKVYFNELNELKGVQNESSGKGGRENVSKV